MSNIDERVKKIVIEQLGVKEDEVSTSSSFVDDLGADSLDTVELVLPPSSRPLITSTLTRTDSFLKNSGRTLA